MNKAGKIVALADENVGEEGFQLLKLNKTNDDGPGLVDYAEKAGLNEPGKTAKTKLQKQLLRELLETQQEISDGHGPYPESVEESRSPHRSLESHFETAEERFAAIKEHAGYATKNALKSEESKMVCETLRPKDKSDPLRVAGSHFDRHPDTVVVFEARVSNVMPLRSDMIQELAIEATRRVYENDTQVSRVVLVNVYDVENPAIEYSYKSWDEHMHPVFEAFIPRGPYPIESANPSPVFRASEK